MVFVYHVLGVSYFLSIYSPVDRQCHVFWRWFPDSSLHWHFMAHHFVYPNIYNSWTLVLGNCYYRITNHGIPHSMSCGTWPIGQVTSYIWITRNTRMCTVRSSDEEDTGDDWLMLPWSLVVASDDGPWRNMERCCSQNHVMMMMVMIMIMEM